jgi:hypothetical protein
VDAAIRDLSEVKSARALSAVAWIGAVAAAVLAITEVGLSLRDPQVGFLGTAVQDGVWVTAFVVFATIGALILSRMPTHAVGWMFVGIGLTSNLLMVLHRYGVNASIEGRPPDPWVAWIGNWLWAPPLLAIATLVPLYFPDGRLPSRRWRIVSWSSKMLIVLISAMGALRPGPLDFPFESVSNPVGSSLPVELFTVLRVLGGLLLSVLVVASGAALLARYRRSSGVARQQLKWFASAVLVMVTLTAPLAVSVFVVEPNNLKAPGWATIFLPIATMLLPIASGVAIFRYRLYDIDLILQRTLLYGVLSAIVAGFFIAAQTFSQRVFSSTTGANSDLAVALSLFVIVAVFTPLKERLQALITARFGSPKGLRPEADTFDTLRKLGDLHSAGVLSDSEFAAKKAELLGRI